MVRLKKTIGKKAVICNCQRCGKKKLCKHKRINPNRWIQCCGKCRKRNRRDWAVKPS